MKAVSSQIGDRSSELCRLGRLALPLMTPNARAEAETLIADLERTDLQVAAAAFEEDMEPVCKAIVAALEAGDMDALRGLRALLPHLLAEVNRDPALADVLAFQIGKSLVKGLITPPEEAL